MSRSGVRGLQIVIQVKKKKQDQVRVGSNGEKGEGLRDT